MLQCTHTRTCKGEEKITAPFACGAVRFGSLELADELLEVEHLLLQREGLVSRHRSFLQEEVLCAHNHIMPHV
jgi:hypothetical protein